MALRTKGPKSLRELYESLQDNPHNPLNEKFLQAQKSLNPKLTPESQT